MSIRWLLFIGVILVISAISHINFAGECMDTPIDQIEYLEKADSKTTKSNIEFSLYCFRIDLNYINTDPGLYTDDILKEFTIKHISIL